MTIVNTTHRFIYVHIPKTAGTSVKHFMAQYTRYCDIEVGGSNDAELIAFYYMKRFKLAKHSFAREIRTAIGRSDFADFFKFSFVRNPFARTASTFNFLKYTWKAWSNAAVMDEFSTLEEFVTSPFFKTPGPDRILLPQMRWLMGGKEQKCVDYIGQVETLEHDLAQICEKLELPQSTIKIGRKNESVYHPSGKGLGEFTGKAVDAIRKRYARDFEELNYSRDPAHIPVRGTAPETLAQTEGLIGL
jgi:hypothetical protein